MKAVGYRRPGSIERPDALEDFTAEKPSPGDHDLLVRVGAVSVNPVDTKVRRAVQPDGEWRVLGFDAVGTVESVGPGVSRFRPGDQVFYAGSIHRPGTNAEFHLVDERIVGHKPTSISDAEAAALPLTSITAWEMLFDRLDVRRAPAQGGGVVLVIGGAGGVGSIALQLLRAETDLTVIATASRPETMAWAKECGAHHVVDHARPLAAQVASLDLGPPGFVFSTTRTDAHLAQAAELIAPQGRFGLIDDPPQLDISVFKRKAVSVHWESMFARPLFDTPDLAAQGALLDRVAELVDTSRVRSTATDVGGPISAASLRAAHAKIESGRTRGKIVLQGF